MAGISSEVFEFNSDRYPVVRYRPGELRELNTSPLSAPYSHVALTLAGLMRGVHHRVRGEIGAEQLATNLSQRSGNVYVALNPRSLQINAYAYAEVTRRLLGRDVLTVLGLEAFDMEVDRSERRAAAAGALHAALTDVADLGLNVLDVYIPTRDVSIPEGDEIKSAEGRGVDFFTEALGMRLSGGKNWGDEGTHMVGRVASVLANIEIAYGPDSVT